MFNIEIESYQDLVTLSDAMPQFVFRGQGDSSWGLSTTIERTCWNNNYMTRFLHSSEKAIIKDFQRQAHLYTSHLPSEDSLIEWLALLQHHGGSTRLLDVSQSMFIAAFFALEQTQGDAAIWCFNEDYLFGHTDNVIREHESFSDLKARSRKVGEECFRGEYSESLVMSIEPDIMNKRILAQQGLFLVPGNINESFESNLAATYGVRPQSLTCSDTWEFKTVEEVVKLDYLEHPLVKIIIPIEVQNKVMYMLEKSNISQRTLFPDLDGVARSLNKYLRDVE
ncbi:FRG domain-containing protein [Vibrio harveyi]|uniref:FRG domain-containing protein n=1 Tax=Vibrio owensii TaxID=696485 RepID=UPI0028759ECE|nr:FRG domain-containing protein [Vibrio harveyi]